MVVASDERYFEVTLHDLQEMVGIYGFDADGVHSCCNQYEHFRAPSYTDENKVYLVRKRLDEDIFFLQCPSDVNPKDIYPNAIEYTKEDGSALLSGPLYVDHSLIPENISVWL